MLEVCCIKLCNPKTEDNYDTLFSRIKILERLIEEGNFAAPAGANGGLNNAANDDNSGGLKKPAASKENKGAKPEKPKPQEVTPDNIKELISRWGEFLDSIAKKTDADSTGPNSQGESTGRGSSASDSVTPIALSLLRGAELLYEDRGLTVAFDYGNNASYIKLKPEDLKEKMSSFFGYCCPVRYGQKEKAKKTRLDNGISDAEAEEKLKNMLNGVDIITEQ
jgi:hypothetical protein